MRGQPRSAVGWGLVAVLLAVFAIPWFLWGVETVALGLPVWIWWHIGWLLFVTVVFWWFTKTGWGVGVPTGEDQR